jgi:hypothetical protein
VGIYFYEKAFDLLTPGGVLCFISSNKYFRAGYGERLRHFLAVNGEVRLLIDFGDEPVFTSIAYPSIIENLAAVPVSKPKAGYERQVGNLVRQILARRKRDSDAYIADLEAEIDGLVAHLYGLTEDEFRLILDDLALPDPVLVGALNAYRETARTLRDEEGQLQIEA